MAGAREAVAFTNGKRLYAASFAIPTENCRAGEKRARRDNLARHRGNLAQRNDGPSAESTRRGIARGTRTPRRARWHRNSFRA
jgi:hypothetical protein